MNSKIVDDLLLGLIQTLDEIGAPNEDEHGNRLSLNGRLTEWLAGARASRHTGASETAVVKHRPIRGSDVADWIKRRRDEYSSTGPLAQVSLIDGTQINSHGYYALDDLLHDYRLHADTGALLDEPVVEGGGDEYS